jgi:hypothetical protein
MKNIRFAAATALAGALTLVGCAAATAPPATATAGSTGASTGKPAALPGLTHVPAYSINTDKAVRRWKDHHAVTSIRPSP